MQEACVTCHNNHPDSPKKDWQVGDVAGYVVYTLDVKKYVGVAKTLAYGIAILLLDFMYHSQYWYDILAESIDDIANGEADCNHAKSNNTRP